MTITKEAFGVTADGHNVERFLIQNSAGVTIAAIAYGAILQSVRVPAPGVEADELVLGFDDLASYEGKHPFFGATVGRFANRIANARFKLRGKTHRLHANNGPNTLHGGLRGFDRYVWSGEMFGDGDRAGVTFSRTSPDGEEGFPGTLSVSVGYSLNEAGELRIDYSARSDAPTPVNLTNHSYWNLAGRNSASTGTILDHEVKLHASHYLPVDEATIPTGEIAPVADTPFDFRTRKRVAADIDKTYGGYDHCFVVDGAVDNRAADQTNGLLPVAEVVDPATGRRMDVATTLPGVQFYTGNKLAGIRERSSGPDGLPRNAALCLETQHFPDAPNKPDFPSAVLRPGEEFRHSTVYRFTTDGSSET